MKHFGSVGWDEIFRVLSFIRYIFLPKLAVALAGLEHVGQALGDEEVSIQNVEAQAARLGQVKVAIVGSVAEVAGGDDELWIIALGVPFGEQMIP